MREGYGTWSVCVCLSVSLSVCLSVCGTYGFSAKLGNMGAFCFVQKLCTYHCNAPPPHSSGGWGDGWGFDLLQINGQPMGVLGVVKSSIIAHIPQYLTLNYVTSCEPRTPFTDYC